MDVLFELKTKKDPHPFFLLRSVGTNLGSSQSTLNRKMSGSSGNVNSIKRSTFRQEIEFGETSQTVDRNYARMVGKELGEKLESFRARIDGMRLQLLHEAAILSRGGMSARNRRSGRDETWNAANNRVVAVGMSNPYVSIR
jgi:hypothetical protein